MQNANGKRVRCVIGKRTPDRRKPTCTLTSVSGTPCPIQQGGNLEMCSLFLLLHCLPRAPSLHLEPFPSPAEVSSAWVSSNTSDLYLTPCPPLASEYHHIWRCVFASWLPFPRNCSTIGGMNIRCGGCCNYDLGNPFPARRVFGGNCRRGRTSSDRTG